MGSGGSTSSIFIQIMSSSPIIRAKQERIQVCYPLLAQTKLHKRYREINPTRSCEENKKLRHWSVRSREENKKLCQQSVSN